MRDIKFRAWDKDRKKWLDIDSFGANHGQIVNTHHDGAWNTGINLIGIDQYTGLKDKNGKEIYEGDILLNPFFGDVWVVKYSDGQYITTLINKQYEEALNVVNDNFEVIGNIHENPELVKGGGQGE